MRGHPGHGTKAADHRRHSCFSQNLQTHSSDHGFEPWCRAVDRFGRQRGVDVCGNRVKTLGVIVGELTNLHVVRLDADVQVSGEVVGQSRMTLRIWVVDHRHIGVSCAKSFGQVGGESIELIELTDDDSKLGQFGTEIFCRVAFAHDAHAWSETRVATCTAQSLQCLRAANSVGDESAILLKIGEDFCRLGAQKSVDPTAIKPHPRKQQLQSGHVVAAEQWRDQIEQAIAEFERRLDEGQPGGVVTDARNSQRPDFLKLCHGLAGGFAKRVDHDFVDVEQTGLRQSPLQVADSRVAVTDGQFFA